jgi:hypothetical protein
MHLAVLLADDVQERLRDIASELRLVHTPNSVRLDLSGAGLGVGAAADLAPERIRIKHKRRFQGTLQVCWGPMAWSAG